MAEINKSITGFVSFGDYREDPNKNIAEVYAIYIDPSYYRSGIGSLLLAEAGSYISTMDFKQIVLWVFDKNSLAKSFYEKNGFTGTFETKKDIRLNNLTEIKYIKI
ncbi:MAG: GNAT family N-acetyltransferase [Rickettsiaceae bacterium]|nr:GNAT family N-acetyltransferase [Rickettsiaceae bacterium]